MANLIQKTAADGARQCPLSDLQAVKVALTSAVEAAPQVEARMQGGVVPGIRTPLQSGLAPK